MREQGRRPAHCVALLSAGCGAPQIALLTMLTVTLVPILQYQAPADYAVWPTHHPDHAPLSEACRAAVIAWSLSGLHKPARSLLHHRQEVALGP